MKHGLVIFLLTLTAYALTAGGHLYSPDEEIYYQVTRSLANFKGNAIHPISPTGFGTQPARPPRIDGREYAQYGIGQPLIAVPLHWLGEWLGSFGTDKTWQKMYGRVGKQLSSRELAPRWACSWFNILVGALMAVTVWMICLELTKDRSASFIAALLYSMGSLAWAHSRTFFSEPLATWGIALSFLCILKSFDRQAYRWLLAAGFAAGYATLVRIDSLFAYPALAILVAGPVRLHALKKNRPFIMGWAIFSLPLLLSALFLLYLNYKQFGHPLTSGYNDQPEGISFSTPLAAGLYGFLFSAGKGIFFFSPALVLSCAGWHLLPRLNIPYRGWVIASLVCMVLAPLLIHSKWINWSGGWCWGPRHIFLIHIFLAVPIAAWIHQCRGKITRIGCSVALITGMSVQIFGSSVDFIEFYRHQYRIPLSENPDSFIVHYDDHDMAYWNRHYELFYSAKPVMHDITETSDPKGIRIPLHLPAPTQLSLYHPRYTVWKGYPIMWSKGLIDNFWINLMELDAPQ